MPVQTPSISQALKIVTGEQVSPGMVSYGYFESESTANDRLLDIRATHRFDIPNGVRAVWPSKKGQDMYYITLKKSDIIISENARALGNI